MVAKKAGTALRYIEYMGVFLCFFLMYLFIIPQSDVFPFAHAIDGSFSSAVTYSLQYGNGRLLGNTIGVYFSYHFAFAGLIVALTLTVIVASLNHIVWDNHVCAVFPLALLVAFPSQGMLEECYYLFAAFCNYVIPVAFFLVSIQILKSIAFDSSIGTRKQQPLLFISLLFAACACLFSENTTIVVIVVSVLFVAGQYLRTKRVSSHLLLYMSAVLTGTLIMYLIPIVTGTGSKMLGYRHVASTPVAIVKQCVISFLKFAHVFNQMYIPISLLSFAMLLLCLKQQRFQASLKKLQTTVFLIYPFLTAGLSVMESHSLIATVTLYHAIEAALVILFAGNIFLTIILTEDKSLRLTLWFFAVTTVLSFAPMMIVNQSGYRTYYTTFVCIAIMALWLLRRHITEYFKSSEKKAQLQRHISTAAASLLLALTLVLFLQSVCNYDFYVMRSNYIAEKITAREDYSVPCMPYEAISVEDTWNGIIRFAYPSAGDSKQITVPLPAWDGFSQYKERILDNPIRALSFAVRNWAYKNPRYPDNLCH